MPALKYWDTATSTWKTGSVGLPSGQVWQQIIGDGLNTSFIVTHGFGTRAVSVSVYRNSSPYEEVQADVERTDTNSVTVRTYPTVPAVSEYIVAVAAAGSQATLNITIDPWHTVGAAGEPAFTGGANESAGNPCQFRKGPDGKVQIRGRWTGGTGTYAIFQLPAGYRPQNITGFTVLTYNNEGAAYVYVNNVGQVVKQSTAATFLDLAVIEFDTDTVLQTASVTAQPLDTTHYVGGSGEPVFQNLWVNYDNSAAVPGTATQRSTRFRKYPDGRVRISGIVKSGTIAQPIFTLPAGYRPPVTDLDFVISSNGVFGVLTVQSDGRVTCTVGTNNWVYLDGIEFDTETVAAYSTGTFPYLPITIDPWHTVGAAGEPAFNAGFAHSGSQVLQFRKLPDGQVKMRGYVSGPVGGGVIFTLPIGYRPPADYVRFPVESVTQTAGTPQTAQVFINAAGAVQAAVSQTANPVNWDLSSVLFDTDTVLQTASVAAQPLDTTHYVGGSGEPAFQNSWVNYDNSAAVPGTATQRSTRFRKYPDGRVRVSGIVKSGTIPQPIFTLPAGYRPPVTDLDFVISSNGVFGVLTVQSDGRVTCTVGTNNWVYLDGIEFDTETVSAYPSAFVQINAPAKVTSLPTSPVDGQEVYYVADATNAVLWHLRYNAGSASAYKWEFVGGSSLASRTNAVVSVSTASYVEPSGSPTITFPLSGDYYVEIFGQVNRTGAGAGNAEANPSVNSSIFPLSRTARVQGSGFTAPNDVATLYLAGVITAQTAASVLRWWIVGGAMDVVFRELTVRPVRVG